MNRRVLILVIAATILIGAVAVFALTSGGADDAVVQDPGTGLGSLEPTASGGSSIDTSTADASTAEGGQRETTDGEAARPVVPVPEGSAISGGSSDSSDPASGDGGSGDTAKPAQPVPVGLSEEQRKAVFWDLIAAWDRAVLEAEKAFPLSADNPDVVAHVKLRMSLIAEYEAEIMDEYDITAAQLETIYNEGIAKRWPMPPYEE